MSDSIPDPVADSEPVADDTTVPPAQAAPDPIVVEATMRRAPRYRAFVGTGALIGVVLGVIASWIARLVWDATSNFGFITFFTALTFVTVGALIGAALAINADRRSVRRSAPDRSH